MTIIYFLILLSVIICIHEAGHLLAAKLFNVYCYEFSFGMGPALFKKQGKETLYAIRLIPMGGFVAMAGENSEEAYPEIEVPDDRRLYNKPVWQRIIILLAGVFMNFLLCFVILSMVYLWAGAFSESPEARIVKVMENSPAERAGLQEGDRITALSQGDRNASIKTFEDMQTFFYMMDNDHVEITVDRNGEPLTIEAIAEKGEDGYYRIGIQGPNANLVKVNFLNCWKYGAKEMGYLARLMGESIRTLIFGRHLEQLSGPVGIYSATEESVSYGLAGYLLLMAQLSMSVGFMNLLPLPVLDGGQVVITLCEAVIGKRLSEKFKIGLMGACWVLLIGLMVFVTWNDIVKMMG